MRLFMRPIPGNGMISLSALALISLASLWGCDAPSPAGLPDEPGNAPVVVPAELRAESGAAQHATVGAALAAPLSVRVLSADAVPVPNVSVTWSLVTGGGSLSTTSTSTDATGSASIVWTLGTAPGSQTVRATAAGLAPVTFTALAEPGPIASLALSHPAGTLLPGQTLQLSATAADAWGNPLPSTDLDWVSDAPAVATVSAEGLVTAVAAGQTDVRVRRGGVADTAAITVEAPPVSREIFLEEGFEDGAFESRGWYDNTSLTRSTTEVHSGSGALEVRFEAGALIPTFGGAARHLFEETETLYIRFRVKYSSNWVGSGVGYHPHDFQILTNLDGIWTGPASTHLTAYVETLYRDGAIRPVLALGDRLNIDAASIGTDLTGITENRAVSGCNGETDGYATTCWSTGGGWGNGKTWRADDAAIPAGEWHLVEVLFEMNSIQDGVGVPDGVARYWLDGDLVLDRQGVLFRTGANANMRFRQFLIAPYIGDGSPVTQTMWIDDLVLGDRR